MTPSEILKKHEDANEHHFHEVDRKWIIEAMEEYKTQSISLPSDEEIEKTLGAAAGGLFCKGAKWMRDRMRDKIKNK